jgi:integrase
MATTATLIRYGFTPFGWRRGPLVKSKNGKFKPEFMVVNGEEVHAPAGHYEIRFRECGKNITKNVGYDLEAAIAACQRWNLQQERIRVEVELGFREPRSLLLQAPVKTLNEYRDGFIKKYTAGSADTKLQYTYNATEFVNLLIRNGRKYPADITEEDVIEYDRWLKEQGNGKSTRVGRYGYVRCFLKYCGLNLDKLISPEEHRKLRFKPKLGVENFENFQIEKLFASAASDKNRLAWRMYWMLGLRDEELAFLEWDNIDWQRKLCLVRFKEKGSFPWNPELSWKSKDSEERDLPIPDVLLEELKAWRKQNPKTRFVVGTEADRPTLKFLDALKRDWRRAGLNCGKCKGCLTKQECKKAKIKTFRATYLTTMLDHCNARDVQALAGHSSLDTTLKYLRPSAMPKMQIAANRAFTPALTVAS